jgi:formate hydrogenlyase subunit 4
MNAWSVAGYLGGLALAPLLPGVANRVKAAFAGRQGPPLLQTYLDVAKLLRKGAVYSRTTTWVFVLLPSAGLAVTALALALTPMGGPALLAFEGDIFLLAYAFALMRFLMVAAALDTGSSFEGMGGSREVQYAVLAEPALFVGFAALARLAHSTSLTDMMGAMTPDTWAQAGLALVLVAVAFVIVALVENCRVPFDDPNTHLELTMIHEVMVLDHGGPDFAMIQYAAAVKLWVLGALAVNLFVPLTGLTGGAALAVFAVGMLGFAALVGVVESVTARVSLLKAPRVLAGAAVVALLAFALVTRFAA